MTMATKPVDNGVNTEALIGAREALSQAPEAAEFTWRASCTWAGGTYSRTKVEGFSGLGQEHSHRQVFTYEADHPECFASEDRGATPVEHVLSALLLTEQPDILLIYLAVKLFCHLQLPVTQIGVGQIVHGHQRGWMFFPEYAA